MGFGNLKKDTIFYLWVEMLPLGCGGPLCDHYGLSLCGILLLASLAQMSRHLTVVATL